MSDLKQHSIDSDVISHIYSHNHSQSAHDIRSSRDFSYIMDQNNLSRDGIFNSISNASPNEGTLKSKSFKSTEQEKTTKEKKKLEKENMTLNDNMKKVLISKGLGELITFDFSWRQQMTI